MTRPGLWPRAAMALLFLTRIPLPRQSFPEGMAIARATPFFPLVGLICGGISAGIFSLGMVLGLAQWVSVMLAVTCLIIITGALHEDGLADCADGFYGGHTKEKRLEIMRDSRVGTYGVLALIVAIGLRVSLLATLVQELVPMAIMAAAVLSRTSMVLLLGLMPMARADGLGKSAGHSTVAEIFVACVIAMAFCATLLPFLSVMAAIAGCACGALPVAWIAMQKVGGATGDVYGAAEQLSGLGILIALQAISTS